MNAASGLETIEAAKVHQPPVVEPSKESFEAVVHDEEFEIPTEEELRTLRRVSGQIPWSAYTIAFVELCERFSYYGTTAVCEFVNSDVMGHLTIDSRQLHSATSPRRKYHWCCPGSKRRHPWCLGHGSTCLDWFDDFVSALLRENRAN